MHQMQPKDFMLTYRSSGYLDMIRFYDFDFAVYVDDMKSTSSYIFMMARGVVS